MIAQLAYVLNLLPREVEFFDGSQKRHVAVAHKLKEILVRRHVPLGNRNHEPQIGPRDFVFERHRLLLQVLDLVHQTRLWLSRIELMTKLRRLELQVVILTEQMGFLLPSQ